MRLRKLLSWLPIKRFRHPPPVVAVVPLSGVIGKLGAFQHGLTLRSVAANLERAFEWPDVKAVALSVNSPGGSPVQSALIARRIRALSAEHEVPVYAFAEDVAASGGYWLLTAGDEIFADDSSIIGSIGVVSAGFGFPDVLKRIGIERRVYTSGTHKAGLDPFRPEDAEEVEHLKHIQEDIHEAFRAQVRDRRAGKLTVPEDDLFNGRFWSGRAAVGLGLVDAIGDLRSTMRMRFGEDVKLKLISDGRPWWRRRMEFLSRDHAAPLTGDLAKSLVSALDEYVVWQRYRL